MRETAERRAVCRVKQGVNRDVLLLCFLEQCVDIARITRWFFDDRIDPLADARQRLSRVLRVPDGDVRGEAGRALRGGDGREESGEGGEDGDVCGGEVGISGGGVA